MATPNFELYNHSHKLVLGFHGCDESVAQKLLSATPTFKLSKNYYDWLGNGMYFCKMTLCTHGSMFLKHNQEIQINFQPLP